MKKNSIFIKLFTLFLLFTLMIMGVLWIMQTNFYGEFYQKRKIKQMEDYSAKINTKIESEGFTEELLSDMEEMAALMSGRIRVMDYWGSTLYQAGNLAGFSSMMGYPREAWETALEGQVVSYKMTGHMGRMSELALLYPTDSYILSLQTPLEPIEESVSISRQFSIYILLVAAILALLMAGIFSRTISKPLVKLNSVAGEMARLNFDVRWEEDRKDEIGELGQTFNFLTDQLRTAFENLKQELIQEKNLDKMRKQFVGRVSHEMQTPIALIRGYTEALQDNMANNEEEKEAYYEIIQEETNKISTMVKDLLDLSQLESGNFKVIIDEFDLGERIDHILSKFQLMKRKKNLKFKVVGVDSDLYVMGDEYRIEQVLNNLIHNAVKYCSPGAVVRVEVKDLGEKVWVGVFNEGAPIPEKDIKYIWESFYKGEERPGTGLGLAIVKNVLELHHSTFGVENEENGVLFYFDLEKTKITK